MAAKIMDKVTEFTKTPKGKIISIALISLMVVLVVVVIGVVFVLFRQVSGTGPEKKPAEESKTEEKTTKDTKEDSKDSEKSPFEDIQPDKEKTVEEDTEEEGVHDPIDVEPRDPFVPLIGPPPETDTGTDTGGTNGGGTDGGTDGGTGGGGTDGGTGGGGAGRDLQSISLENIYSQGGVKYASIKYGGKVYEVKEGDQVGSTPLQVISIFETSVILLYGDERITVRLGQEVYK